MEKTPRIHRHLPLPRYGTVANNPEFLSQATPVRARTSRRSRWRIILVLERCRCPHSHRMASNQGWREERAKNKPSGVHHIDGSVMPKVVFDKLTHATLAPTAMCLQQVDQSIRYPIGIAEDVLVKIRNFIIPAPERGGGRWQRGPRRRVQRQWCRSAEAAGGGAGVWRRPTAAQGCWRRRRGEERFTRVVYVCVAGRGSRDWGMGL